MELEGQAAIVTGAGRGIGRSIALELATLGADIVVADVLDDNAEQVAEEIHALGRQAIPIHVDVTARSDLDAMAAKAMSEFGRLDVLVNNAGVNWFGSVLDVTEESWDFVMDVNAKAVFFASQAVLPHMMAAKRGSIVSLASMAGQAWQHLQRGVRGQQGGRHQHHAQPGAVGRAVRHPSELRLPWLHPLHRYVAAGRGRRGWRARLLARRDQPAAAGPDPPRPLEEPEDVAKLIGFLASDRSWYITGEDVNVSGGLVMH